MTYQRISVQYYLLYHPFIYQCTGVYMYMHVCMYRLKYMYQCISITTNKSTESNWIDTFRVIDTHLCWFAPKHFADAKCSSVARWPWPPLSHSNQAVQKICAEKLVAVEVAVSSNKVLWYKSSLILKICVMFNPKMESRNKKWQNPSPNIMYSWFFIDVVLWNIMQPQNFWLP